MPLAVPSRSSLTFQPWRSSKQSRYSSTRQDLNSVPNNEIMAAMLHGEKINGGQRVASKRSSLEHAPSHASNNSSAIPDAHESKESSHASRKGHRWEGRGSTPAKRKAAASKSQPSAKRQCSKARELKDEYYIRRTMRIPTPEEYPDVPKDIFKRPKYTMTSVAHSNRLAECRSECLALDNDAYQCTAYYNSAMHSEAVIGEGRTMASHSVC